MQVRFLKLGRALLFGIAILGFQSAMAGVSAIQATSDLSNAYYQFNFTNSPKFLRVFLDTDRMNSSGYRAYGVGADYLIENNYLYRYSGSNGSWGWSMIKSIPTNRSASSVKWTVSRVDLKSPSALNYVVQMDSPISTSSVLAQTLMAPAASVSLAVDGAPNLPLNGTSTKVTVGFVSGTPTKVELSRDGYAPFAIWPSGSFFTLSADGKSLTGNWCITSNCWGGVSGAHVLNVVATYSNGQVARAAVQLNVADAPAPTPTPTPTPEPTPTPTPSPTPAPIPANKVSLSDFGGVPGAAPSTILNAFNQAYARLKALGGGTLMIPQGDYNLGSYPSEVFIMNVADLKNVLISGYGARLIITTTAAKGMPVIMGFTNPSNVTIAGLSFTDHGTDLNINWKGAVCISVDSTRAISGFKTVDIVADKVGTMFRSLASARYTATNYDIHGTVKNAYYGVSSSYNGRFSKANVTVHNTRRAFISYGARDWDVTVKGSADGVALGSNAYIEVVPIGGTFVENVNINLTMSGNAKNYSGLVHFYNQGALSDYSYTRNVKAHVVLNALAGFASRVFVFDHEYPVGVIPSTSPRTYEQVALSGQVIGMFGGTMISMPTASSGSGNSITVSSSISNYVNFSNLPSYFRVVP